MHNSVQTINTLSGELERLAVSIEESAGYSKLADGTIDNALAYLAKKQRDFSGEAYFDQIEKNAVYLHESAFSCCVAGAVYIETGQPYITDEPAAMQFVMEQRGLAQAVTRAQLQYLHAGCPGCDWHHLHSIWDNYREQRQSTNREAYVEELEFACIHNQIMFHLAEYYLNNLLLNQAFGRYWRHLPQGEVLDLLMLKVGSRTALWSGLLRLDGNIVEEKDGDRFIGYKLVPETKPPTKPTWQQVWGERYQRVARENGISVAQFPQARSTSASAEAQSESKPRWQFWKR